MVAHRQTTRSGLISFLRHLFAIMTIGDRLLLLLFVAMGIMCIFVVQSWLEPGKISAVFVANRLIARWSLANAGNYTVAGQLGEVQLRIINNSIRVVHSQCPERICIRQGAISRRGELIVCVPNRMVVTIEGHERNSFDAITR